MNMSRSMCCRTKVLKLPKIEYLKRVVRSPDPIACQISNLAM
jgi:hypothetical protein